MSRILAEPQRISLQYAGYFAEPVFGILGAPANLYRNLLRRLAPFGASLDRLGVNVSAFAETHVTCQLTNGHVRVWLDRVEIFLSGVESQDEVSQVVERVWAAMAETDPSLQPDKHTITLLAWAALSNATFESYIGRFVAVPTAEALSWKPKLQFDQADSAGVTTGSILLEEAEGIPGGLFVRSVLNLGSAAPDAADLFASFRRRLREQLESVNLDLPIVEKR